MHLPSRAFTRRVDDGEGPVSGLARSIGREIDHQLNGVTSARWRGATRQNCLRPARHGAYWARVASGRQFMRIPAGATARKAAHWLKNPRLTQITGSQAVALLLSWPKTVGDARSRGLVESNQVQMALVSDGQPFAIRRTGNVVDAILTQPDAEHVAARRDVREMHIAMVVTADNRPLIRAQGDTADAALVAEDRPPGRCRVAVPDSERSVVAAAREPAAVTAEGHTPDRVLVALIDVLSVRRST